MAVEEEGFREPTPTPRELPQEVVDAVEMLADVLEVTPDFPGESRQFLLGFVQALGDPHMLVIHTPISSRTADDLREFAAKFDAGQADRVTIMEEEVVDAGVVEEPEEVMQPQPAPRLAPLPSTLTDPQLPEFEPDDPAEDVESVQDDEERRAEIEAEAELREMEAEEARTRGEDPPARGSTVHRKMEEGARRALAANKPSVEDYARPIGEEVRPDDQHIPDAGQGEVQPKQRKRTSQGTVPEEEMVIENPKQR